MISLYNTIALIGRIKGASSSWCKHEVRVHLKLFSPTNTYDGFGKNVGNRHGKTIQQNVIILS